MKKGDFWVEHTQMWLNNTFGNHKDWKRLSEDGVTGSATMEGLIRAFQINNNISPVTGGVGPLTKKKFKELPIISKMDPDGPTDINVFIIQGALFCKGYNAGGLTGILYNKGVAALKELESDAGIDQVGTIGWKEWTALLSMNWFKLVYSGDPQIRVIQQQLNSDFSDHIGVGPCDGVVSRQTSQSLIGAVQAAGGIKVVDDLNQINFGEQTLAACERLYKENNINYIKIVKYGLYFNGFKDRDFWPQITQYTKDLIVEFQVKHALAGLKPFITGEPNAALMKSLLTSNGVDREAVACDCATILNLQQAKDLSKAGYKIVGRYLTGTVGDDFKPKNLTLQEIENIKSANLSIFPIYQDGGYKKEYFLNESRGVSDASTAILAAKKVGIPAGTTIYFAVDFDCFGNDIKNYIIPYFEKINMVFKSSKNSKNYNIGVYGPREVCTKLQHIAKYSFVSDMSTGFTGNLGKPIPDNWAFDQFKEYKFTSNPTFDLDKDGFRNTDKGCNTFDSVSDMDDIFNKEEADMQEYNARINYTYSFLDSIGYLDEIVNVNIAFDEKMFLKSYTSGNLDVKLNLVVYTKYKAVTGDNPILIELGKDGKPTAAFMNKVSDFATKFDTKESKKIEDFLYNTAVSVKTGVINNTIEMTSPTTAKITFTVSTDDLPIDNDKKIETTVALEIELSLRGKDHEFDRETIRELVLSGMVVGTTVLAIFAFKAKFVVGFFTFLAKIGMNFIKVIIPGK